MFTNFLLAILPGVIFVALIYFSFRDSKSKPAMQDKRALKNDSKTSSESAEKIN